MLATDTYRGTSLNTTVFACATCDQMMPSSNSGEVDSGTAERRQGSILYAKLVVSGTAKQTTIFADSTHAPGELKPFHGIGRGPKTSANIPGGAPDAAVEVARTVYGVQKIVKVFEYLE